MKKEVIEYLSDISVIRNHLTLLLNSSNRKFSKTDYKFLSEKINDFDYLFMNTLKLGDIPLGFKDNQETQEVKQTKKTVTFENINFDEIFKTSSTKEVETQSKPELVSCDCSDCDCSCCDNSIQDTQVTPLPKREVPTISTSEEDELLLKKRLAEEKKKLQKKAKSAKAKNTSGK